MLSGKEASLLLETSRIFNLSKQPMESGSSTKILAETLSSSRFSSPATESGRTCSSNALRLINQLITKINRLISLFHIIPIYCTPEH